MPSVNTFSFDLRSKTANRQNTENRLSLNSCFYLKYIFCILLKIKQNLPLPVLTLYIFYYTYNIDKTITYPMRY